MKHDTKIEIDSIEFYCLKISTKIEILSMKHVKL